MSLPTAGVGPAALPRMRFSPRGQNVAIGAAGIVAFLIVWQAVASFRLVKVILVSSPLLVGTQLVADVQAPTFWHDVAVTIEEWWLGFAIAALVGVPLGLVAGWYRGARRIAEPWLNVLYAVPYLAVVPLFILWFGIGFEFKVFVAFLSAIFNIAVNTMAGAHATDAVLLDMAGTFGASRAKIFRTIVIPGSVPYVMTGLRQGAGHALVGAVAAEFLASNQGLGFRIISAGQTLNTPEVMIGIVLLAALGVLSGVAFRIVEQRFERWRKPT